MKKIPPEYWNLSDECEHYPIILEWWAVESFFSTNENNKKWNLKAVFTEWLENKKNIESKFNLILYDIENNIYYTNYQKKNTKLEIKKNILDIKFDNNHLRGHYPNYNMNLNDNKNKIKITMNYQSESYPHWIAKNITNGYLPSGLGYYRYGFIPKNKITGNIKIKNNLYSIEGTGYFEHVWGNFIYDNPLSNLNSIKKIIPIYIKLIGWWLKNHKVKIPNKISVATENNPIGYDWAWAILDNGWTLFYGNILFWLMNGPVMGTLILTKDGINYKEYGKVNFQYNKIQRSKNYDFYYPTEIELTAKDKSETIHLKFTINKEVNEYKSIFPRGKYWRGIVICEGTGKVEGKYINENKEINLKGIAKIEPQRQISIIGHNSLSIELTKPPKGLGILFELDSNLINKKINANFQIIPHPHAKVKINKKTKD